MTPPDHQPFGLLITLEGGEGAGKSTQLTRLAARLREQRQSVIARREPGGTNSGERIRLLTREPLSPLTELFLFEAARAQLVTEVIRPSLNAGAVVILDRFTDSTLAYQGYGRGVDIAQIRWLNDLATGNLTPDMTFLLDIDVEHGLARKLGEIGQDAIGREHLQFHQRVRSGYQALAKAEPERWTVLDAAQAPDAIADRIWESISVRLDRDR